VWICFSIFSVQLYTSVAVMSLNIFLDDATKAVYTAGDRVKGRVVLQSAKDEAVGQVSIVFLGRTKTKIRRRNHNRQQTLHRGRGSLFWYSKLLYRGHYTLRAERYEWPFEFAFPFEAKGRSGDDPFDRSPPFRAINDVHPLPPSFGHDGSGFNTNFECFVEYKLEASLTRPQESYKLFSSGITTERRLDFLPSRDIQHPDLGLRTVRESFAVRTLRLLPEKADAKLTMKEKMRSTFKKDDLPTATFAVFIVHPTLLIRGSPFPLHLCVKHTSTTLDEKPTIFLQSIKVETKTRVFVRSPGFIGDYNDNDAFRRQLTQPQRINIAIPESSDNISTSQVPDVSSWLDLTDRVNTQSLPIDFTTYNIAIFSKLDITVQVACADKMFKMKKETGLVVLPGTYGPPISTAVPVTEFTAGMDPGPSAPVAPPPYEPAPEYQITGESSGGKQIAELK
jgi:hypothetical protein